MEKEFIALYLSRSGKSVKGESQYCLTLQGTLDVDPSLFDTLENCWGLS